MARVNVVDYLEMPKHAQEMREGAKQLNSEVSVAYTSIRDMHTVWYGVRYNELVKAFNNMIPQLNEMLTLVVHDVPHALETIANNYSMADRGVVAGAVRDEQPNKIIEIAIINDEKMGFLSENVKEVQQKVSTNFKNAKDLMDKISTYFGKVTWDSRASEEFNARFMKLKGEIITSFENINTQFIKLMEQTLQDMENAERANTVG